VNRDFLSLVATIHPEAWDALIPRYLGSHVAHGFDEVALNPQPLPPRAFGLGARVLADLLHGAIIIQGGRDGDAPSAFLADVEDWCGTRWPRWRPKPPPPPWGWDERDLFTGAALQAAVLAGRFEHDPEMQEALLTAAERLAQAAG
jgi:hypothetical protein